MWNVFFQGITSIIQTFIFFAMSEQLRFSSIAEKSCSPVPVLRHVFREAAHRVIAAELLNFIHSHSSLGP